ncbi:uncharacterized protein CANTADRAFT_48609 [Suhomyces tanzawaensis NRRL Y-17324]|uniref:Rab-GAP TBC domain-containing protein n=1 Tax=Suhomyces tanzawaensis NRRL Y-17324 TaxID=984487 RepID=A0A1E4SL51_9ASCO|nr:uncharacterized protein CANTADRAFT_48609 [Suhomyces tanzawaensis NRRL Y-17324]ODV80218.1 hypothetical protein CANTADRAFT_48609 [Suhomyces tanzawaensis NRRL Y-17324]
MSTSESPAPALTIASHPPGPYSKAQAKHSKSALNLAASAASHTHTPSPLQNQIPVSRSSSVTSTSSSSSNATSKTSTAQYLVQVDKTPQNLTPSQRLMLRKSQLNNSIARFKSSEQVAEPSATVDAAATPKMSTIDSEDEEIDDHECVFNVPVSQSLVSLSQREKFTFGNQDRKYSFTNTDSTRSSSILSHGSLVDTDSTFTSYDDTSFTGGKFNLNIDELRLSKDAHDLSLMFNQDEFIQDYEESRQRKKLLNTFTKVNSSSPSLSAPQERGLYLTNDARAVSSPVLPHSMTLKSRSASTQTLPLMAIATNKQRSSSSFSKYYSFTRPTWLPPKSSHDKKKHQKESEDIIYQALIKESKEQSKKMYYLERIKKLKIKDSKIWYLLLDTDNHKEFINKVEKVDHAWWRGITPELRGQIWWKHYGGTNKFNVTLCNYFFDKIDKTVLPEIKSLESLLLENKKLKFSLDQYKKTNYKEQTSPSIYKNFIDAQSKLNGKISSLLNMSIEKELKVSTVKVLYDTITNDLLDVYPDLNFFQNYEVIQNLTRIVMCLVFYLYESAPAYQDESLQKFYFPGINHLAAMFYFSYKNVEKTFVSMCQFYDHQIQSLLLNYRLLSNDKNEKNMERGLVVNSLYDVFIEKFETTFFKKLNLLFTHFKVIGITSFDYLPLLMLGLFSQLLNFQVCNHLMDTYIFEKHDYLIRLVLGFFKTIQYKLFGSKAEVLALLGVKSTSADGRIHTHTYLNVGNEYEFMETIKDFEL